jgi:hypothetical protein
LAAKGTLTNVCHIADNSAVVESGLFSIVEATNFNVEEIYKISKQSLYTVVVGTKKIESVNG